MLDPDHSADSDNASDVSNPYLYTGRRADSESNLMQYLCGAGKSILPGRSFGSTGGITRLHSRKPANACARFKQCPLISQLVMLRRGENVWLCESQWGDLAQQTALHKPGES